jgi:tRNA 5-methylaminomethyl-2-thiouridine biosynthesis bifunctional protein
VSGARPRQVILETGFGTGDRFLFAWRRWSDHCEAAPRSAATLVYIAIEPKPCAFDGLADDAADPAENARRAALRSAWPPPTRNLHRLAFENGMVQLFLVIGSPVTEALRTLVARVDRFRIDAWAIDGGSFDIPATDAPLRLLRALSRLAAPDARLLLHDWKDDALHHCATAGFRLLPVDAGFEGERAGARAPAGHDTARDALREAIYDLPFTRGGHAAAATIRHRSTDAGRRRAVIVGAGLAGCATAWALAERGWTCRVVERRAAVAAEASGNPAGLFHGIVHVADGVHARWGRAAALEAGRAVRTAIGGHGAVGAADGMLRLESMLHVTAMRTLIARLALPPSYVQALDAAAASDCAGFDVQLPAWFYPGGGSIDPGALARAFLERAGSAVSFSGDTAVDTLVQDDEHADRASGPSTAWRLRNREGATIDCAEVVVLANAGDALRLLRGLGPSMESLPLQRVRGQLGLLPASACSVRPLRPVAGGGGYLLPAIDGRLVFGATAHVDDDDPAVRGADHGANLARLRRLVGGDAQIDADAIEGRTAWRWVTPDRLPLVGAVPLRSEERPGGSRRGTGTARAAGLYVHAGLGSRGIAACALGAQLLAAVVDGGPLPLEAALVDAVDPARFALRRARRSR